MSPLYFQCAFLGGPLISLLSRGYAAGTLSLEPLVVSSVVEVHGFDDPVYKEWWDIENPVPSGTLVTFTPK